MLVRIYFHTSVIHYSWAVNLICLFACLVNAHSPPPFFSFLGSSPSKPIKKLETAVEKLHRDISGTRAIVGVLRQTMEESGVTFDDEDEEGEEEEQEGVEEEEEQAEGPEQSVWVPAGRNE